jgi:hypothetical protein
MKKCPFPVNFTIPVTPDPPIHSGLSEKTLRRFAFFCVLVYTGVTILEKVFMKMSGVQS